MADKWKVDNVKAHKDGSLSADIGLAVTKEPVMAQILDPRKRAESIESWICPDCEMALEEIPTKDLHPVYRDKTIARRCTNPKCDFMCVINKNRGAGGERNKSTVQEEKMPEKKFIVCSPIGTGVAIKVVVYSELEALLKLLSDGGWNEKIMEWAQATDEPGCWCSSEKVVVITANENQLLV